MGRSTVHYADNETNNILKRLHNKLRPAGTPVERVEYIIELLLLRIFETKLKRDETFTPLRKLFEGKENYKLLFSYLLSLNGDQILFELNKNIFPFYATILVKSREVINTNLPIKIYDQLVLMEEVFANSNFTNNVKGGVIAEVIGLVNEIEEKWILKTDLLGDAIESALSETGGTRDLGLYRTPDHIRKMMVEMVDPDFTDTIFDPACGTAGFLFNAYEYAIEKARITRKMPIENITNQFYRTGIGGIEYSGRIRKMAAVNLYIQGLNPHNIEQGDSLKMYDPSQDANSKSIIISNPPFGAERDQPSYPNVWEEYSKESETTILFVKLMFNLLKQGGRCAVIVSEGFLTWGQNSACTLRKILLNETNLRAIISLPQGVFVSKNGQGAKTSILYFEKGQPTDFVWYYKIENDGFSMGTNRKPIDGSQIPEMLGLFKELKKGNKPIDSKYSFCIPKEWIENIDPRFAISIKNDIEERIVEKNKLKREKIVKDLKKQLSEGKINQSKYDNRLWQFENIVQSQIENEVVKNIEKAHTYHFNLQNYRSNLSEEQIQEWKELLKDLKLSNNLNIKKQYQELKSADLGKGLQIIASFDPQNALNVDIAREFMFEQDKNTIERDIIYKKLDKILKNGFRYPFLKLKDLIIINNEKIKPSECPEIEFTLLGVSNQIGIFINEKLKGQAIKQTYYKVYKDQFCYNPYRINVGSIGLNENNYENQIISGAYNVFGCKEDELNPKYLEALFKTDKFLNYVKEKASGGVRMDFKIEYLQNWEIPVPPIEIQEEIVQRIEKQLQIIEGAEKIVGSSSIDIDFSNYPKIKLSNIASKITQGPNPKYDGEISKKYYVLKTKDLYDDAIYYDTADSISEEIYIQNKSFKLQQDDLLIAIVGQGSIGKINIFQEQIDKNYIFTRALGLIRANKQKVLPSYLHCYFLSLEGKRKVNEGIDGTTGQLVLKTSYLKQLDMPLPIMETQQQIIKKIKTQMQAIETVKLLKEAAEKRIAEILKEVW
jgi:type I restriction-modification system DNA methylase subunit